MKKILILIFYIFSFETFAAEFRVAFPMLPDYNPLANQISTGNYIGAHLYYPLFDYDAEANTYSSSFLNLQTTKSISKRFDKYNFCLKQDLKFVDGTPINIGDFVESIRKFSEMYPHLMQLKSVHSVSSDCAVLELKKPTNGLFKYLTGPASTIVKSTDLGKSFPTGLGPYKLVSVTPKEISLQISKELEGTVKYNKIKFELIEKEGQNLDSFDDTNQLPSSSEKDKNVKGNRIEAPAMKVYTILVNLKNRDERMKAISDLVKVDWVKVFGLDIEPNRHFLPWLHKEDYQYDFSKFKNSGGGKVPFIVPLFYDIKKVEWALKEKMVLNHFKLVSLPVDEFRKWAFSGKEYVALVGFDSSGSVSSLEGDFAVYFETFFAKKSSRIVTDAIEPIKKFMLQASDRGITTLERTEVMKKADDYLINNFHILGLGKVRRSFIYPRHIKIEKWFDFYSGIPKIHEIK